MEESKRFPLIVGLVVVGLAVAYFGLRPSAKPRVEPVEEAVAPLVQAPKATVQEAAPEAPVETPPEQPLAKPPEPPKEEPKAVAKEPEKPMEVAAQVVEIDDLVKALEYRDDFLPAGYSLMEMPPEVDRTNPGYVSAETITKWSAEMAQDMGTTVSLKRAYTCLFKNQANNNASYEVFELASHDEAVALENVVKAKAAAETQRVGMASFVIRNCLVAVQYTAGNEQIANDLLPKLKAAVHYKD